MNLDFLLEHEQIIYEKFKNMELEDMIFDYIERKENGSIIRTEVHFDLIKKGEAPQKIIFNLDPITKKLNNISSYVYGEVGVWNVYAKRNNEVFNFFNSFWEKYRDHHKLKVRLIFY